MHAAAASNSAYRQSVLHEEREGGAALGGDGHQIADKVARDDNSDRGLHAPPLKSERERGHEPEQLRPICERRHLRSAKAHLRRFGGLGENREPAAEYQHRGHVAGIVIAGSNNSATSRSMSQQHRRQREPKLREISS